MTLALTLCLGLLPLAAGDDPVELGQVDWLRDHDAAFEQARRTEKPVLLLFQEIPG
jgi:hypothetical protein